ncbi:DUF4136 domain-containing protein [Catenovulum sp. SM1970]|uniref:DUF4136 domain-containing protein n=1 Tax=Marinifaba aquimaris TaxID=2741323 RepID=UPI0015730D6B|nr:DUF4136 domain-containing protein [Marinifaba aquimaris]NTS78557.1 DUF4136 domain-containing protein [Marinifaba aquimaris]
MKVIFPLILSIFMLSACVQVTEQSSTMSDPLMVTGTHDINASYPKGAKFIITPKYINESTKNTHKRIYQSYAQSIQTNLENAGYQVVTSTQSVPDFRVLFALALEKELSDSVISDKFGITPGLHTSNDQEKGSFLIAVENTRTGERLWRGAAQGLVHQEYNMQQRQQRTKQVVEQVLTQFYR